jgi:hypothetical protein
VKQRGLSISIDLAMSPGMAEWNVIVPQCVPQAADFCYGMRRGLHEPEPRRSVPSTLATLVYAERMEAQFSCFADNSPRPEAFLLAAVSDEASAPSATLMLSQVEGTGATIETAGERCTFSAVLLGKRRSRSLIVVISPMK